MSRAAVPPCHETDNQPTRFPEKLAFDTVVMNCERRPDLPHHPAARNAIGEAEVSMPNCQRPTIHRFQRTDRLFSLRNPASGRLLRTPPSSVIES